MYLSAQRCVGHDNPSRTRTSEHCLLLSFFCIVTIDVHQASRSDFTGVFCSEARANPNHLIPEDASNQTETCTVEGFSLAVWPTSCLCLNRQSP
jgi:hypothetical protein